MEKEYLKQMSYEVQLIINQKLYDNKVIDYKMYQLFLEYILKKINNCL